MGKKSTPTIDEQINQKQEELTQAQMKQTNAYSEYMKAMKAKMFADEGETEKIQKIDELMFQHFTDYQQALEQCKKLQYEISELESQKYLEDLITE